MVEKTAKWKSKTPSTLEMFWRLVTAFGENEVNDLGNGLFLPHVLVENEKLI